MYGSPTPLQPGSTGPAVLSLQRRLLAKGYLSAAALATGPGVFGPRTQAAVRAFQKAYGLPVTGVAGAHTLAALNSFAPSTWEAAHP